MKRIISIALLLAGAALLSGCPKKHNVIEPPAAGSQVSGSSTNGSDSASTSGRALNGDASAQGANGANGAGDYTTGPLAKKVIYFDFDKSEIKPEFADWSLLMRAICPRIRISRSSSKAIPISAAPANTTSGSGERRAQAVRRAMMLQGVAESQLTTVSFGAERPAAEGDDEAAWSQNRRVELVYAP